MNGGAQLIAASERDEEGREAIQADAVLLGLFLVLVLLNGAVVFLPDLFGGSLLRAALPVFGLAATVLAMAIAAFGVLRRRRPWAPVLLSLACVGLAVADALLWVIYVHAG